MPSSSARAQAWSGPAPPKATSAKSRGSRPCSTETTRRARTISAFTTSITPAGSIPARARSAAARSSSIPPGSIVGSRPRSRFASVTVARAAAAPVARRAGIGARALGADAQRPTLVEPDDRASARADRVHGERGEPDRKLRRRDARARDVRRRRRSRTRPSTCRPCRTRARSRSRRARRAAPRPRRRRPGRRGVRTPRAPRPPPASRGRPTSASRGASEVARPCRRPRGRRDSGRGRARGTRRQRSSTRARTRGTREPPRATRRRARSDSGVLSSSATRRSGSLSRNEKSSETAIASASISGSVARSSGTSSPRGPVRPRTPKQRSSGTSGGGCSTHGRYRCARVWRRRCRTCSKPSFVTSAVRAPRRSRSAFVAIVVPCVKRSTSSAPTAAAASTTDALLSCGSSEPSRSGSHRPRRAPRR